MIKQDSLIINYFSLPIILALTEEEQNRGLMFKKQLPPAMVFPFKESKIKSFWMKNTFCPLDIIFCNNNKIIKIAKGFPLSEQHISSDQPSDLVIEVAAGNAAKFGAKVGTSIKINYSIVSLAKLFENKLT